MGPFLILNSALIGFFAFAALYHLILWWTSRRETLLAVFGIDCAMRSIFSGVVMAIGTAESVAEAQNAMYARVILGILIIVTWVWSLSLIAQVRAQWYVRSITALFFVLLLIHLFVRPLNANVTTLQTYTLPWGESIVNPQVDSPRWWFVPVYAIVMSIEAFGLYCSFRLWKHDKVASALILSATCAYLLLHVAHAFKSYGVVNFPFVGVVGHLFWASMIGLVIARRNHQMREQVAASEERFRALVEHGFEGINIVDEQGRVVYAGPGNASLMGYAAEETLGSSPFERIHPDDLATAQATWVASRQTPGQIYTPRVRVRHKDGSWRWMEVSACNLLHLPAVRGIVVNWRDITPRKMAEDKLQESEERKAAVFESAFDALITIQSDGSVVEWNPAAERIFGYSQAAAIGRCLADLIIPPRLRESHQRGMAHLLSTGEGPVLRRLMEMSAIRADGTEFPVELYITPIRTQPPLFSGFIRDITERKMAEEEHRKLETQILHTQKLESLGVLAGGIAHDFNNLLTVVLGNASLSLMQLPSESPSRAMLHEIELAARRAADLTQQMLAYSGKGRFIVQPLRLDLLVQEMAKLLKSAVSKKTTIELSVEPATIAADATQIRQVVMNLIINASDALQGNVGSIRVRTGVRDMNAADLSSPYVPEELSAGSVVYFEVQDSGCGMSEETLSRIFDPFFTTKFAGRGLGLAAVLGIVRGHHGTIKVASTPSQGTLFQVLFPCSAMTASAGFDPARQETMPRGQGTILVIEDEPIVHSLVRHVLESAGFQVLIAEDGHEGLTTFGEHRQSIVAVLLDLTMPRIDGLEVLREMRRQAPHVPILLMSGYSEQDVSIRSADGDASGYIQKPFNPRELVERICEILPAA